MKVIGLFQFIKRLKEPSDPALFELYYPSRYTGCTPPPITYDQRWQPCLNWITRNFLASEQPNAYDWFEQFIRIEMTQNMKVISNALRLAQLLDLMRKQKGVNQKFKDFCDAVYAENDAVHHCERGAWLFVAYDDEERAYEEFNLVPTERYSQQRFDNLMYMGQCYSLQPDKKLDQAILPLLVAMNIAKEKKQTIKHEHFVECKRSLYLLLTGRIPKNKYEFKKNAKEHQYSWEIEEEGLERLIQKYKVDHSKVEAMVVEEAPRHRSTCSL